MTCNDASRTNVYELVEIQKHSEWKEQAVWRIPLFIFISVVALLIILLIFYIVWQQIKLRRAILSDDWKIERKAITLNWTEKQGIIGMFMAVLGIQKLPSKIKRQIIWHLFLF